MPEAAPFERHTERYEGWFEEHEAAYQSELEALRRLIPTTGYGVEIGVGSARFAAPLGMQVGIDPAGKMLQYARDREDPEVVYNHPYPSARLGVELAMYLQNRFISSVRRR
ncbi:hypothetical protein SAMN04487948_11980 [Halogranum amylolyticum]|uniref:Methyltransferase domain-containing protein n=1 Tax=Halogranum amylolyticum TaxID=660520 RepID=A0A1H8VU30_9EURY|nr:hypothetical protein [Halogranum amylolyticum]SEP18916.1 hypothetical protein SAMN04487948_11980 [Halogranum amylolyticum]